MRVAGGPARRHYAGGGGSPGDRRPGAAWVRPGRGSDVFALSVLSVVIVFLGYADCDSATGSIEQGLQASVFRTTGIVLTKTISRSVFRLLCYLLGEEGSYKSQVAGE